MSINDYRVGQEIEKHWDSDDFYGVIQGAMRLADNDNLEKLKAAWPEAWTELQVRYNAPFGLIKGEEGTEPPIRKDNPNG